MNSMVYSVIQVNFTINQAYIIDNFCVNTDRPELKCDGKCFLADQFKAQKERQESTPAFTFNQDFGVYIPNTPFEYTPLLIIQKSIDHLSFYENQFLNFGNTEIDHPPQG
jgi:hypothetical protein